MATTWLPKISPHSAKPRFEVRISALLIAGIDQLEEQVAPARRDRQVADLVDDEQRGAAEEANTFAQRTLAFGLGELGDEIGERDKVDKFAGTYRLDSEGNCKMALAGAGRPEQVNHFGAGDEVETGQSHDSIAIERRLEGEVEPGERLDHRQSRHAQRRLDPAVLAQRQFLEEQFVECLDAVDLALFDPAQGDIEHLERSRHSKADQTVTDIVDP